MKQINRKFMLVIVLVITLVASSSAFAQTDITDLSTTSQLAELEPYITTTKDGGIFRQELDYPAAIKAGFSPDILDLASEMVASQNEYAMLVETNNKVDDISNFSPDPSRFPRLSNFFLEMKNKGSAPKSQNSITADPPACGNWDYPVPNYTPSRVPFSGYSNPSQTLINWGFHKTAGYGCGQDPFVTCDNDYTRGRSYTGAYGTCSSPRFRDQGIVTSTSSFNIQYGEPNPEILSYLWPYWNWGVYVKYWHDTY